MQTSDSYPIHVRAKGHTYQLRVRTTELARSASDDAVVDFVERALDLGRRALSDHAVDRAGDSVVIRPWAVWG